jgi:hypothetical protein
LYRRVARDQGVPIVDTTHPPHAVNRRLHQYRGTPA